MMNLKKTAFLVTFTVLVFFGFSTADNPISNYHYLADPTAFSTDSTFYIVTDTDDECPSTGENDYKIRALYAFSSKDMKNWTDHGMVLRYNREVSYISNIWASGAVAHDGVFYIIYPNGASGVGIVSSKDIAGPYIDPVGKLLVGGGGVTDCGGISWCFDPAIFVDDDGKAYMTYGGGSSGSRPYGDNFDLFQFSKLSHDQVTLDVNSRTRISGANKSFEASYIHKRNGTYYLSYNDQSQAISYATSKNIKGPYTYQGVVINNPSSINGKGGNNHHGFAQFKDKWYAVYHDRRLVMDPEHPAAGGQINGLTTGNHRSTSIDEVTWNGDKMNVVKFTESGPTQIADFKPYGVYKAITSSKQRNVRSRTDYTKGQPVLNVLTPLATKESWIRVSGVDFGKGATRFRVTAASVAEGNKVEIHKGSVTGTLAGTCDLKNTGNWNSYEDNECEVTSLSGIVDQLFLVFKGSKDSTMGLIEWEFIGEGGGSSTTQTPHGGTASILPGKIEVENYDDGGSRRGYSDTDAENKGDAEMRADEGVDLVLGGTGVALGYTAAGEWLEYTVNVENDANDVSISASVSSGVETSSFCILVDGVQVGDTVKVAKTGEDWSVYETVNIGKTSLTKGPHEIRLLITGDNVNVDWISFGDIPTSIAQTKFHYNEPMTYQVFNMKGAMLGTVKLDRMNATQALRAAGFTKGIYMLKQVQGNKKFVVNATR